MSFADDLPISERELLNKLANMSVWSRAYPYHVAFTSTIERLQPLIAQYYGVPATEVDFGWPELTQADQGWNDGGYEYWRIPLAVAGVSRGHLRALPGENVGRADAYDRVFEVVLTHPFDVASDDVWDRLQRWFNTEDIGYRDQVEEDPPPGYAEATSPAGAALRDGQLLGTFQIVMPVVPVADPHPDYPDDVETDHDHVYEVRIGAPGVLLS